MSIDYQMHLVAFSVAIAMLASYTALRLAWRLAWAAAASRPWWIAGGALALSFGIWAMHFVGMLAVHLPVPLAYDPWWTAASLLPAVLAPAIALATLARGAASRRARLLAGALMGLGIVAMHYSGMEAMRMQPPIRYDGPWFLLSVLIAVGASTAAVQLLFQERHRAGLTPGRRVLAAVLMGLAIAGMHYAGMAAVRLAPDAVCTVAASGLSGQAMGWLVGTVAVVVLLASLGLTALDAVLGENNFLRALLAAQSDADVGVLVVAGQRVLYANEAMARLGGRRRAELLALADWRELLSEPAPPLPHWRGAGATTRAELLLATPQGPRPCELVCSAFAHADELRHLLLFNDISERHAAQAALRAQQEHNRELALVASNTDNAVLILDAQARIRWVNEGFVRMSGYSLQEAQGRTPGELLNGPDTDAQTLARIRQHVAGGERFEAEIVHYHKSGRPYWAIIDVQPVHDEQGRLHKYISIERDITARKQAELALQHSAELLREAQQLARMGSFETELDGTGSTRIYLSPEAQAIHEVHSPDGWVDADVVWARMHPDDVAAYRQARQAALASGEPLSAQHRIVLPDGRIKHLHVRARVLADAQGRPQRLIGSVQDVTEQKLAEQALRELNETLERRVQERTQALREANESLNRSLENLRQAQAQLVQSEKMAALGALVAGISHEINTPLGIGLTAATALQEQLQQLRAGFESGSLRRSDLQRHIAQGLEGADILVRNLQRAAELIRSFKQVAVDQSSQERRTLDLARYIDEVILSLQPRFKGGRIRIEHTSLPGLVIDTEPGAIAQILTNLLLNAQMHAYDQDQAGTIRVQARRCGDQVELICADDGKGIAPQHRARIFDPFFTTRRGSGGSGLGLHIVYNLVVGKLQGRIELLDDAGCGTTFRITFPARPGAQEVIHEPD